MWSRSSVRIAALKSMNLSARLPHRDLYTVTLESFAPCKATGRLRRSLPVVDRSTTLRERSRSDRGTAGLAESSARIASNGARMIIVRRRPLRPRPSWFMKSPSGSRCRDTGRTVVRLILYCPLSDIVSARATAGGVVGSFQRSNRLFHPCGVRDLDRQNELELRPILAVGQRRKLTAMTLNNHAANG